MLKPLVIQCLLHRGVHHRRRRRHRLLHLQGSHLRLDLCASLEVLHQRRLTCRSWMIRLTRISKYDPAIE